MIDLRVFIVLLVTVVTLSTVSPVEAGWLLYHKPEFKGRVVDAATGEPLEGAVVVAVYRKRTVGLGGGTVPSIIEIKEAVTDENGAFKIPAYRTVIQPFSWSDDCTFIIFKRGYGSSYDFGLETVLTGERKKHLEMESRGFTFRYLAPGVVELPKLRTVEDRKMFHVSPAEDSDHSSCWYFRKQKLLIAEIRTEQQYLFGNHQRDLYKWEGCE